MSFKGQMYRAALSRGPLHPCKEAVLRKNPSPPTHTITHANSIGLIAIGADRCVRAGSAVAKLVVNGNIAGCIQHHSLNRLRPRIYLYVYSPPLEAGPEATNQHF